MNNVNGKWIEENYLVSPKNGASSTNSQNGGSQETLHSPSKGGK